MRNELLILALLVFLLAGAAFALAGPAPKPKQNPLVKREDYIRAAVEFMRRGGDPAFDPATFTNVTVRQSNEDTIVDFTRQVYFLPSDTAFYGDTKVIFYKKDIFPSSSRDIVSNRPESDRTEEKEYTLDGKTKKKLDFVIKAINQGTSGDRDLDPASFPKNAKLVIREKADHYAVEFDDQYVSVYKISKKTGELYDAWHYHLEPTQIPGDEKIYREL